MTATQKDILILTVVALVPRALVLLIAQESPERMLVHDASDYVRPALNLLHGNGWSQSTESPFLPDTRRTPGYPLFLMPFIATWNQWQLPVAMAQIALNIITVVVTYLLGKQLMSRQASLVAALLLAVSVSHVVYSVLIMSDVLFSLSILLPTYLLVKWRDSVSVTQVLAIGMLFGLSSLIRPISWLFILAVAPLLIWRLRHDMGKGLGRAAVLITASLVMVAPWMIRNYQIIDTPLISSVPLKNLLLHNAAALQSATQNLPASSFRADLERQLSNDLARLGQSDDLATRYQLYRERGLSIISQQPVRYTVVHLKGTLNSLLPNINDLLELIGVTSGHRGTLDTLNLHGLVAAVKHYFRNVFWVLPLVLPLILTLGIIYLGALIGILHLYRQNKWFLALLLISIGYFLLPVGPLSVPRFRIPVQPHLCLLAGIGLTIGVERFRQSRRPRTAPATGSTRNHRAAGNQQAVTDFSEGLNR